MIDRNKFTDLIRRAADPDNAAEALADMQTAAQEIFDFIDSGNETIQKLNETVANLRDSNMRLFLRVTGDQQEDKDKSEEDFLGDVENRIAEKFGGGKDA